MTSTTTKSLSIIEERLLEDLEAIVTDGLATFIAVGTALMEIRDQRLYRQTHGTFEDYCQDKWAMTRQHANRLIGASSVVANLEPIGARPDTESQARPLAALQPEQQQEAWRKAQEAAQAEQRKLTAKDVQAAVDDLQAKPHVANNSGDNEWYTPQQYTAAARVVMGNIDLDPASTPFANQTVRATRFYTAEEDGLAQEWKGCIWLNPPYSRDLCHKFCRKLIDSIQTGDVPEAVILVNNATETEWFQLLITHASAVCLPAGRIVFLKTDGERNHPLQGQAIIYCGQRPQAFAHAFETFGAVLYTTPRQGQREDAKAQDEP